MDVRKATFAQWSSAQSTGTSLTGSTLLSMSNNAKYSDSTLTSWDRNLPADSVLSFFVDAVSGSSTFDQVAVAMKLKKVQ